MNVPLSNQLSVKDIREMSDRARSMLAHIKRAMLAPNSEKVEPRFSTARLSELVNLSAQQIDYRAKKSGSELPPGAMTKTNRREFSLGDVRSWCRALRPERMRRRDLAEAVTIAVANFKGGVGKSTTSMSLAQGLSMRGHDVLLVDLDPQGSATTLCGLLPHEDVAELDTVLALCIPDGKPGHQESIEYAVRKTYWSGIDIVPANTQLYNAEFILPTRGRAERGFEFWNVLHYALEQARQQYDCIILDTSPSLSYTTINAMMAADGVIMPLPPNGLDFVSSIEFWDLFQDLAENLVTRGANKTYDFVSVLLSKVSTNDPATEVVREWIKSSYTTSVMNAEIPLTSTAGSASAEFGAIYDMRPGSASTRTIKRAIEAYDKMVLEVEGYLVKTWERRMAENMEMVR